jgi:centromeric protein E
MLEGDGNRKIGETNMNEKSSRSHTIFRIAIESRSNAKNGDSDIGAVKVANLNLVDLAGSERVGHTGAEGLRLKEGGHINKSLLALSTVIGKLSEGKDRYLIFINQVHTFHTETRNLQESYSHH